MDVKAHLPINNSSVCRFAVLYCRREVCPEGPSDAQILQQKTFSGPIIPWLLRRHFAEFMCTKYYIDAIAGLLRFNGGWHLQARASKSDNMSSSQVYPTQNCVERRKGKVQMQHNKLRFFCKSFAMFYQWKKLYLSFSIRGEGRTKKRPSSKKRAGEELLR